MSEQSETRIRRGAVGLLLFVPFLAFATAAVAENATAACAPAVAASSSGGLAIVADNWGKRAGITCGEQYTGTNQPGKIAQYCIGCCDAAMNNPPIDQWNNCIAHCNERAAGTASVGIGSTGVSASVAALPTNAATSPVVIIAETHCSNNGDCPDDKKWCTHCRDGKKIPEAEWFCADHDEHQAHEKGCNGLSIEDQGSFGFGS